MRSGNAKKVVRMYKIVSDSQIPALKKNLSKSYRLRHKDCVDINNK